MATDRSVTWAPDWRIAPGEILGEALQDRGLTQTDLARRMGRPVKTINEIVNGKAAITPETAIQLERTLGISASFWNSLETRYREHLARDEAQRQLEAQSDWLRHFPTSHLGKLGLIRRAGAKADMLADLLRFFGVSSPEAWQREWEHTFAARRSSRAFAALPHATSVWLRWGELSAAERYDTITGPFDEGEFRAAIGSARGLSRVQPFMIAVSKLQKLFARCGVIIVLLPEVRGTRLSGAARWLDRDRALIQLSLRHRSDDQFWFTVFHEFGHLVESAGRRDFVDAPTDIGATNASGEELAADHFARDVLIPPESYASFVAQADFSPQAARTFAMEIGISPGIVAGRLQQEGRIGPDKLNFLKQRYTWPTDTDSRTRG